ncbi:hypothetical protein K8I61_20420 [bacterium]|nr:hypothetical protein [bacterium]
MSTTPLSSRILNRHAAGAFVREIPDSESRSPALPSTAARAESMQKTGKRMIFAGFVMTVVGVILYCAACFAGGMDTDIGDILFRNAVPFARGTLAFLGLGTLVWLVGSFTYLRGAMEADEDAREESGSGTP